MSGVPFPKPAIEASTLTADYADNNYEVDTNTGDQCIFYVKYTSEDNANRDLRLKIEFQGQPDATETFYRGTTENPNLATGVVVLQRKEYSYIGSDGDGVAEYFSIVVPTGDKAVKISAKEIGSGTFGEVEIFYMTNWIGPA